MAWTSPRTWAVGETLTAANMNTHIKDNENWLANDRPRCSAVRATGLSVSDNTVTTLSLNDADEYDIGGMHDPASNNTRITVPSGGGGLYTVKGMVAWQTSGAGSLRRVIGFNKNGAGISNTGDMRDADTSGNCLQSSAFDIVLVAGDYIEMTVYQNSGGNLNAAGRLQLIWQAF